MLSKKSQYAFQALMYLSEKENEGPVLIAEISKKKRIPLKFLENILLELKKRVYWKVKKEKEAAISLERPQSGYAGNRYAPDRRPDFPASLREFVFL